MQIVERARTKNLRTVDQIGAIINRVSIIPRDWLIFALRRGTRVTLRRISLTPVIATCVARRTRNASEEGAATLAPVIAAPYSLKNGSPSRNRGERLRAELRLAAKFPTVSDRLRNQGSSMYFGTPERIHKRTIKSSQGRRVPRGKKIMNYAC